MGSPYLNFLLPLWDVKPNICGMDTKYKQVLKNFHRRLLPLEPGRRIDIKRGNEGIHLCNNALYLLKGLVEDHGFGTVEEEIHFFKTVKSVPLGYLVYFSEVRSSELLMPKMGIGNQLRFLEKKIERINKFFNRNWDFVHYMEQELTYMDRQYFTRDNLVFPLYALPEACYLDPKFFTSHDMLWARVKGLTTFIDYLQDRIKTLKALKANSLTKGRSQKKLVWSASKTAMVELIYALHSSLVIDHGKEEIKGIASAFEEVFEVRLDNIYKTFMEIKARKGIRGRFLEELVQRFNEKMDRDDDL